MQAFEYTVIPAPRKGQKVKGAKTVAERFGVALSQVMNDMARDGWEYLRADSLPCEERVGLTGTATHFHHMLVFRRALARPVAALPAEPAPLAAEAAAQVAPVLPALPSPAAPAEARPPVSPFAAPVPGRAPALGPAAPPPAPVVPFPNGRG